MNGDGYPCDDCGDFVDKFDRVDEYLVNAHTYEFERLAERCPACAQSYGKRRAFGEVENWLLEIIQESMYRYYGDPVIVRWLQGDEHRVVVLVQRSPLIEEP